MTKHADPWYDFPLNITENIDMGQPGSNAQVAEYAVEVMRRHSLDLNVPQWDALCMYVAHIVGDVGEALMFFDGGETVGIMACLDDDDELTRDYIMSFWAKTLDEMREAGSNGIGAPNDFGMYLIEQYELLHEVQARSPRNA